MVVFGNRVMCLVVLFLFQSAGWMGMAQGVALHSIGVKENLAYEGTQAGTLMVTFDISKEYCDTIGGFLASGYTKAQRTEIMNLVADPSMSGRINIFVGADMEYSVHIEPVLSQRCKYDEPSINCIYKWNQGLWAYAVSDGSGVGFFKGNAPGLRGGGVINGYDVTVIFLPGPSTRRYVMLNNHYGDPTDFIMDPIASGGTVQTGIPRGMSMIACEVQDGTIDGVIVTITKAPATHAPQRPNSEVSGAPENLDDNPGMSKGLTAVLVILPILIVILAVVLCLYFCGCICRHKDDDQQVIEDPGVTIQNDLEGSVMHRKSETPNMGTAAVNGMNPLLGEGGQSRQEVGRNTWIETSQQANVLVRANSEMPSDSDSAAEQQSRRLRSMRRSRSNRRMSMNMTEVQISVGSEIVEETVSEWN